MKILIDYNNNTHRFRQFTQVNMALDYAERLLSDKIEDTVSLCINHQLKDIGGWVINLHTKDNIMYDSDFTVIQGQNFNLSIYKRLLT